MYNINVNTDPWNWRAKENCKGQQWKYWTKTVNIKMGEKAG